MTLSETNDKDDFIELTRPFTRKRKFQQQLNQRDLVFNTEPSQNKQIRKLVNLEEIRLNKDFAGLRGVTQTIKQNDNANVGTENKK